MDCPQCSYPMDFYGFWRCPSCHYEMLNPAQEELFATDEEIELAQAIANLFEGKTDAEATWGKPN